MNDHEKFIKKLFACDNWWDSPTHRTLNRLFQLNFIDRLSHLWPEREEYRPQWNYIYNERDTTLIFPSTGDDPLWVNVPDDERVGSDEDPFSEKDIGICQMCHKYGCWDIIRKDGQPDTLCCIVGCQRCVEENGFSWGKVKLPADHPYQETIDIHCNGSFVEEITNHDLILRILTDIWDQHPDYDPPKWSVFFDKSPTWVHTVLCEILGFIDGPEVAKEYFMEAGQPLFIQDIPSGLDGSWALDEGGGDEDEDEANVNKEKSAEGLQIIEEIMDSEGQIMDQGKFIQLCDIFRDIHQQ